MLTQLGSSRGIEAQLLGSDLSDSGTVARRLGALLDELQSRAVGTDRRTRVQAIRERLDESCRTRFASGIDEAVLSPLRERDDAVAAEEQTGLEVAARHLRCLETEGRRIGSGPAYDALLDDAVGALQEASRLRRLSLPRHIRLLEILAGTEAALALLDGEDQLIARAAGA